MQHCPICHYPLKSCDAQNDNFKIDCPRCGFFEITRTAAESVVVRKMNPRSAANIAGLLYRNSGMVISASNIYSLLEIKTPSFSERGEKLFRALERSNPNPGQQIVVDVESNPNWLSRAYACDEKELAELLDYLAEMGYLRKKDNMRGPYHVSITPSGFVHLDKNRAVSPESLQGFAALGPEEAHSELFSQAIAPAVSAAGFIAYRLDAPLLGSLGDEAVAAIRRSRFVVADFASESCGVYYQAGLASGLGLEVICLAAEKQASKLPDGLGRYGAIYYSRDNLSGLAARLETRITALLGKPKSQALQGMKK